MKKISEIQNNIEEYLNDDTLYYWINVYDTTLEEMSRQGKIPHSQLEIHIEGGEGNIPHMHICKKTEKNIVLRLKLLSNEYFREKDDVMNALSSSERKALNEYLMRKVPFSDDTEWVNIINAWNRFNPSHMVNPHTIKQPDYTIIKEPK